MAAVGQEEKLLCEMADETSPSDSSIHTYTSR